MAKNNEADPIPQLAVSVTQGVPDMRVKVNEGNVVGHEGVLYGPDQEAGDEVVLPGPTALSQEVAGHVTILNEEGP